MYTVKKMCSRGYHSLFNKIEKVWVGVEILCLDFPKSRSNEYNRGKRQPLKIVRFFLIDVSHMYRSIKPPCRVAIIRKKTPIYSFDGWKTLNIVRKSFILSVAGIPHLLFFKTERKKKKG